MKREIKARVQNEINNCLWKIKQTKHLTDLTLDQTALMTK